MGRFGSGCEGMRQESNEGEVFARPKAQAQIPWGDLGFPPWAVCRRCSQASCKSIPRLLGTKNEHGMSLRTGRSGSGREGRQESDERSMCKA